MGLRNTQAGARKIPLVRCRDSDWVVRAVNDLDGATSASAVWDVSGMTKGHAILYRLYEGVDPQPVTTYHERWLRASSVDCHWFNTRLPDIATPTTYTLSVTADGQVVSEEQLVLR